ncbi:hypothetical protein Pmani_008815 [Petrolisthes manimaculis]|uniref:HEPN domain-containing protein n=1 Tax=Petrolisthes manimaculis TaxID=1843537 RepID=A0AAE1Q613_9EUCA|nr:hypothetical protein Pmani_008815 [Petrolisthes manimaculis]
MGAVSGDADNVDHIPEAEGVFRNVKFELPTVIGHIKNILSQYPDNGQIIKELVQNGEDAGASKVNVVHDTRSLEFPEAHQDVQRFIRGPALCLYNDAVFRQEDWNGVCKLCDSIKKDDPLRIGQFGLGFKSVFHITDYITIISGSQVLFMDPSASVLFIHPGKPPVDQTCRFVSLSDLGKVLPESIALQLWGTYLTSRHILTGTFPATLFWFPLRQQPSQLSPTVYTKDSVRQLFDSFSVEAPICLTFLRALEQVSLQRVERDPKTPVLVHQVGYHNHGVSDARQQRQNLRHILHQCEGRPSKSITSQYQVTIHSTKDGQLSKQTMLVLHYLPGQQDKYCIKYKGNAPHRYIPLVGVAVPTRPIATSEAQGSLFTSLPIPLDPANATGLPIQVNAYFTLVQNRRYVKWRTHDSSKEPDEIWNEELVSEVVLEAYHKLLLYVHDQTVQGVYQPQMWYSVLPHLGTTTAGRWQQLATQLWSKILILPILHSQTHGFLTTQNVITDASLHDYSAQVNRCIGKVLQCYQKPLVTLPSHVTTSLHWLNSTPPTVTPDLVRECLRSGGGEVKCECDTITLLEYITSDQHYHNQLNGLQLLPLNDGSWSTYSNSSHPIYICTSNEAAALWGLQSYILQLNLSSVLHSRLDKVAQLGTTQLVQFKATQHGRNLLTRSVNRVQRKGDLGRQQLQDWLRKVWSLLQQMDLSTITHLPLLPSCPSPTSSNNLLSLSSPIIVQNLLCPLLSNSAIQTLKLWDIKVVTRLPRYVRHHQLYSYLYDSNGSGVNKALSKMISISTIQNIVTSFNVKSSNVEHEALINVIDLNTLQPDVKKFLAKLNIFISVRECGNIKNDCVKRVIYILPPDLVDFPVHFPVTILKHQTTRHQQLAIILGAELLSKEKLCLLALNSRNTYSKREMCKLALYILSDNNLMTNTSICQWLKSLKFVSNVNDVLHLPGELYDPRDGDIDALIDEDLTPSHRFHQYLPSLVKLGLNKVINLPQHLLIQAITNVQSPSINTEEKARKSLALLKVLEHRQDYKAVCMAVRDVAFIYGVTVKPSDYPVHLGWETKPHLLTPTSLKSYSKYKDVLGSVIQLVDCSHLPKVAKGFNWNMDPDTSNFCDHFWNMITAYQFSTRGCFEMSKKIYKYLSNIVKSSDDHNLECLSDLPCVFTEYGFKFSHQVFLQPAVDDVILLPYIYPLPYELREWTDLFVFWGCFVNQSRDLYLKFIRDVQNYHNTDAEDNVHQDRKMVVSVLEKLDKYVDEIPPSELLLPVENDDNSLELVKKELCSYSDQHCDWLSSDDLEVRIVHKCIPLKLAQSLGVKQLSQHLLLGGETMMEWGQNEPLTTSLNNLLHQYRDGVAIMKELVQNADDAGATTVSFLYDERQNEDARTRLLSPQLEQWQGPALWAYNDATFTEDDFKNLRKLGGGTKELQSTKIGKFGFGFCSVYNLTDVPSFVSGSSYVIFDPHLEYLGHENKAPGLRYSFEKEKTSRLLSKLHGQFKPFNEMFDCAFQDTKEYDGTLFRFPLRTPLQAERSKICKISYGRTDMMQLLHMLWNVAGQILLFTQNVKEIKVFHLASNASTPTEMKLLFESSSVPLNEPLPNKVNKSPLKKVNSLFRKHSGFQWNGKIYQDTTMVNINVKSYPEGKEICENKVRSESVTWIISWHSGNGRLCRLAEKLSGKALPLGAVSTPICQDSSGWKPVCLKDLPSGFYKESHMHCFLPLPVKTSLPLQVNGYFEIASDRTALLSQTSDDRQNLSWNSILIEDAISSAYLTLLQHLISLGQNTEVPYYTLWPLATDGNNDLITTLITSFYNLLVKEKWQIFYSNDGWHPLIHCLFLEDHFYQKQIEMRDDLTLHMIDYVDACMESLQGIASIPTHPYGKLRDPRDLIYPKSQVAKMYSESDERFPQDKFTQTSNRCDVLLDLGMKRKTIPASHTTSHMEETVTFTNTSDLYASHFKELVGSTELILRPIQGKNQYKVQESVLDKLGVTVDYLPLESVIEQLVVFSNAPLLDKIHARCHAIYEYLEKVLKYQPTSPSELHNFQNKNILLTKMHGFVGPRLFALSIEHDCAPDLFSASIEGLDKYKLLMNALDITTNFSFNVVEKTILSKKETWGEEKLSDEAVSQMSKLVGELFKYQRLEGSSHRMHFGQKEPLTTRLRNILQDYPYDSGIMKELLQNADDAGATEIVFIIDLRHLPTDKLFDKKYAPLQGPSLSVYNNKGFTANDLKSIQDLGNCTKKEDPTCTGQYGIGFNVVYHLTDAPSFLTKGPDVPQGSTICMFDPHCRYDPSAMVEAPGVRFTNLDELRKDHPDSFIGYLETKFLQTEGTVFRLPLRSSADSDISKNVVTKSDLKKLVLEFQDEMSKCMLFLRSVRKASIVRIDETGKWHENYSVNSKVYKEVDQLSSSILCRKKQSNNTNENLYAPEMVRDSYRMQITDNTEETNNWIIVQQVGAHNKESVPDIVKEAFHLGSLRLLPHASVALLLDTTTKQNIKNLFTTSCYLPLPSASGLPFSVNGHFTLSSSRRDLWSGTGDCKDLWNQWLMKEVLVPAAVYALDNYRLNKFHQTSYYLNEQEYSSMIYSFQKQLPDMKDMKSAMWKCFTKWFYEHVKDNGVPFFDVFIPERDEIQKCSQGSNSTRPPDPPRNGHLHWHPLTEPDSEFPVYFLHCYFFKPNVPDTLKRLGMKISSYIMCCKLESADPEYQYQKVTPTSALNFLTSWNQHFPDNCKPQLENVVEKTPFLKAENVLDLFKYISPELTESSNSSIVNLPLLLTNDNVLRPFTNSKPVFISKYCSLLPNLGGEFVEKSMVSEIKKHFNNFKEAKVVKSFTTADLRDRLPSVLDSSYQSDNPIILPTNLYDPDNIPNKGWLEQVWRFVTYYCRSKFTRKIRTPTTTVSKVNWEASKEHILQTLGDWALYPVTVAGITYLVSINNAWRSLDMYSFDYNSPFRVLPIPKPCPQYKDKDIIPSELKFSATKEDPHAVLEVLHFHKNKISEYITKNQQSQSSLDVRDILEYLGRHCKTKDGLCKKKISQLTIFMNATGQYCSVFDRHIILPVSLNLADMNQIALYNGYVILEEPSSSYIRDLYKYIDPEYLSQDVDIYSKFILPNLEYLEEPQRMSYLKILKGKVTELYHDSEDKPPEVVSVLRNTRFIQLNGRLQTANNVYDPSNPVFSVMKVANLPKEWDGSNWNNFLRMAGMIHEVTPYKYLEFARSLKASDPDVEAKSEVLIQHLEEYHSDMENVRSDIEDIEFLVPYNIDNSMNIESILPCFKTTSGLVSISQSVHSKYKYVVWSTASILPEYATQLDISGTPPEDKVLQHITNFCDACSRVKCTVNKKVMESIYEYLMTQNNICDDLKQKDVPVVHIPNHRVFVSASKVMENLEYEILPYLYMASTRYGKYFDVFKKMGMKNQANCDTYAQVLTRIYECNMQQELHPEEMERMTKALNGMLKCELNLTVDTLYLPTQKRTLRKSTEMFVADNDKLLRAVQSQLKEPLFLGFAPLKIYYDNGDFVKRLPERLRPKFVSQIIEENLVIDGIEETFSPKVVQVKESLGSLAFETGILRVMNHFKVKESVGLSSEEHPDIKTKLTQVVVRELKEIEVTLKYCDNEVGTKRRKYHLQQKDNNNTLYISQDIPSNTLERALISMYSNLLNFNTIEELKYTEEKLKCLYIIFGCIIKPHDIHTQLDEHDIMESGTLNFLHELYSTDVGSYLDERFLHLLDNSFGDFHAGEIVCMKKYDLEDLEDGDEGREDMGEEDNTFVIVKVLHLEEKSSVCQMMNIYEVSKGDEDPTFTVKAHSLYRFVREVSDSVIPFTHQQGKTEEERKYERTEEELRKQIFKQVFEIWRVEIERDRRSLLRRLMLEWHPDKNSLRKELCTRVFQYIQSLVGRLEREETIPEDDLDSDLALGPSRAYNYNYSRSTFSSTFGEPYSGSFTHQPRTRMGDRPESLKWWRHADHDLEDAGSHLGRPACYTIYICMQAAEKLLKACIYQVDRDAAASLKIHSLTRLCQELNLPNVLELTQQLEAKVGNINGMRYPDFRSGCPCDHYGEEDALFVLEKVRNLKQLLMSNFNF